MPRLRGCLGSISGALVLAAGVLVGACGDGDSPGSAGLASLAPPDAPVYVEGVIRPEGDQAEAVNSIVERVGGITDPGAAVTGELDAYFAENELELSFADDIEPWLGDRGAVFVSSFETTDASAGWPDFAALIEVDDADGAREFLDTVLEQDPASEEERSYEGNDYFASEPGLAVGVVDDRALVAGTETAFKVAVDASQGESLDASEEYTDRIDALPDDPLGSAFFEPAAAIEAAIASEGLDRADAQMIGPLLGGLLSQPIAATLTATPDAATVNVAAMIDSSESLSTAPSLLSGLPGGSWLAIAAPELGSTLEHGFDQLSSSGLPGAGQIERQVREATGLDLGDDVFSWLGEAAAFIQGTGAPGLSAGLIAETNDPQAPRALLDALKRLAERDSGLRSTGPPAGADYGFSIGVPGIGGGAEAGVIGDMFVAALGTTARQALEPSESLGDNPAFQAATSSLGDDVSPAIYIDLPSLLQVAEQGSDGDVDYDQVRPYADAFASLAAGSRVDGDLAITRVTVLLDE
jgi:hypothetical protein